MKEVIFCILSVVGSDYSHFHWHKHSTIRKWRGLKLTIIVQLMITKSINAIHAEVEVFLWISIENENEILSIQNQ